MLNFECLLVCVIWLLVGLFLFGFCLWVSVQVLFQFVVCKVFSGVELIVGDVCYLSFVYVFCMVVVGIVLDVCCCCVDVEFKVYDDVFNVVYSVVCVILIVSDQQVLCDLQW